MREYVIVTDSSADLTAQQVADLGVEVLPLTFTMDGVTYENWPDNRAMSPKEFFDLLRQGKNPTTAAVNVAAYTTLLDSILASGKDVLVLSFSSGLSGTYQSSKIAGDEMAEKYPDQEVRVVDTLSGSLGQGMLVWYAARMQQAGKDIDTVQAWVEETRHNISHWFTVDDLHFLKRGGRVSATTAVVGTMLQIKPVLHVDAEGHLVSVEKARGRAAALNTLAKRVKDTAINPTEHLAYITHGDCLEDAQTVATMIQEQAGIKEVIINDIGPVTGSHTGPGVVALFFLGTPR